MADERTFTMKVQVSTRWIDGRRDTHQRDIVFTAAGHPQSDLTEEFGHVASLLWIDIGEDKPWTLTEVQRITLDREFPNGTTQTLTYTRA